MLYDDPDALHAGFSHAQYEQTGSQVPRRRSSLLLQSQQLQQQLNVARNEAMNATNDDEGAPNAHLQTNKLMRSMIGSRDQQQEEDEANLVKR